MFKQYIYIYIIYMQVNIKLKKWSVIIFFLNTYF